MAFDQNRVQTQYRKLLALYPRGFRERLGESMEQTFHDLYNEHKRVPTRGFLVLSIFTETAIGIVREHLLTHLTQISVNLVHEKQQTAGLVQ